ncbi:restriction endonuclease [Helicobacter acinonychis]|uniref:Type III restriction enzyme R protein n=1 Tax=Helicobacter acinonychis (strain Sheeba) TaxID=382638 RepID=Q17W29_HELAH|nr:DEAD/DEAH box helicase family protein [Helicobacter acinonychis]CAK00147.1 type III restriction enzyme R protein [Helicobacter acinonychis str. Sheeba]STP03457.1 type III restriction enzyme R protein [Helicobacter acinonychis]
MIFEKQDYQQECINNIITLLNGFDFKHHNALVLKDCVSKFYATHEIPVKNLSGKLNVDILMETGTGKTFTYLNLIFALHKAYKQNKFIIFVPRKAILESVKQNIRLTKDYFHLEFKRHLKTYTYEGAKSQSNIINHYIKNQDELSVLLLTNSAIDKGANILNKNSENLFNTKSIFENIAGLKPISIIDEPHLLKGEAFSKYFSKIGALYFRFGATFAKEKEHALSNVAFCLDSISAFRNYLVKQIKVHSIVQDSQAPFLLNADQKSAKIAFYKAGILKQSAVLKGEDLGKIDAQFSGISLVKSTKDKAYLSDGTTLEKASSYKLVQDEISTLLEKAIDLHFEKEKFLFSQNIKPLSLFFIPRIEDFRQIEGKGTPFIKTEFERLYKLKRASILAKADLSPSYKEYLERDFDESGNLRVYQGYFSGDSIALNKCKKESNRENIEANDIKMILSEKEKLLSLQTPLRFIFSVWALQEGWDNPNIFTLTKLASSTSETSRHQQVGRGLRIAVNNEGKRVTHGFLNANDSAFYEINYLDMLVSGEEVGFIEGLQKEIEASSFISGGSVLDRENLANLGLNDREINKLCIKLEDLNALEFDENSNTYKIIAPIYETMQNNENIKSFLGEKFSTVLSAFKMAENATNKHDQVINANQPQEKVKIRQDLAKEFKELWQTINMQANLIYQNIQKTALIETIAKAFNKNHVRREVITVESKRYDAKTNQIITEESSVLKEKNYTNALQKEINALLLDFAKDERLPLKFILELYNALNKEHFKNSPKKAFDLLKNIIKDELHANLLSCVSYEFCQNAFSNMAFDTTDPLYFKDGSPKTEIEKHKIGKYKSEQTPSQNYLYETIIYDSKIEEEVSKEKALKIENKSIEVFAKLPKFKIPTPYKNYEPDFAYLLKDNKGEKIFFVCETKGYENESRIPQDEKRKIDYAKKFFETLSDHLKDAQIKVIFATRISKQNLLSALNNALKDRNDR